MNRKYAFVLLLLVLVFFAAPVFAQGSAPAEAAAGSGVNWVAIAAGFGMAIASGLCGLAQGKAVASAMEGLARNPAARPGIQLGLIIGLAFIESLALYTLVIIFAKVK